MTATTLPDEPLPALMRSLAASGDAHDWPWYAASRRGLWMRAAGQAIAWPEWLPPLPEPVLPRPRRPWLDLLFERIAGLVRPRRSSAPAAEAERAPAKAAPLTSSLIASHLWLARKNIAFAARWFHPLDRLLPAGLVEISDQGLVWGLLVTHARRWGGGALGSALQRVERIGGLAERTTLGDCVALHVLLEEWCAEMAAARGIAARDLAGRRHGGLRSPETLTTIPLLRAAEPAWWEAFHLLALRSPLTLLVYADLFDTTNAALPRFAALFHMRSEGSLELWISHLARSLLAACSSPAPAEEERLRAMRAAESALDAARAKWSAAWGSAPPERDAAVVAAREELARMEGVCRAQLWQRTILLGAIAQASLFFHLRFLDLLVRSCVSACDGEIRSRWKARHADHYDEPRDVFFFDGERHDPICRHALERLLWRRTGDVPPPPLRAAAEGAWASLRPASWSVDHVAASATVYRSAADDLLERYETRPIALSIPGKWAHPPHEIWSEWSSVIGNRIHRERRGAA